MSYKGEDSEVHSLRKLSQNLLFCRINQTCKLIIGTTCKKSENYIECGKIIPGFDAQGKLHKEM